MRRVRRNPERIDLQRGDAGIDRSMTIHQRGTLARRGSSRFANHAVHAVAAVGLLLMISGFAPSEAVAGTVVRFDTDLGSFDVHLFDTAMPQTVGNFLSYVGSGGYDGSVVHRASDIFDPTLRDFVIQGGGYFLNDPTPPATAITFDTVVTDPAIADEPGGGVAGPSNVRGTIAMAKSGPNTATSQWFINQGDNSPLDDPSRGDGGFAAFGLVLGSGMDVVDAIGALPLPNDFGFGIASPFNDLPLQDFSGSSLQDIREVNTVVVRSVSVVPEPSSGLVPGIVLLALLGARARSRATDPA